MATFGYMGNGVSKDFLKDVRGIIVTTKGTSQAVTAAKTLAGWQAIICPATAAAITGTYIDLARGFELKTQAAEMVTSNTGFKEKTKDFAPEFTGYAFMSYDDYAAWFAADGKELDFTFVLADGKLMSALTSAGLAKGFSGRMFVEYDLPKAGGAEKQKACPFEIILDDVEEIKNRQVLSTDFTRRELEAVVPVGIKIEVVTAYSGSTGVVVLKATHRASGLPYAGFTTYAQWAVISLSTDTGGAATAITATSANLGLYEVTFLNTTPKLTGDFEIQASTIVNSKVVYLSNILNVPV